MRVVACVLPLFLLACPAAAPDVPDAGLPADAGDAPDAGETHTFAFGTDRAARIAWNAIDLPWKLSFTITPQLDFPPPSGCPSVTRTADGWRATTDCTDADGATWSGTVTVHRTIGSDRVSYVFEYATFGVTNATSSLVLDGTVRSTQRASDCGFPGPAPLTGDDGLRVTLGGAGIENNGGYFPGAGETVTLTYAGYSYAWDLQCDPASLVASGVVDVLGEGDFRIESSFVDGDCNREPESGSATFTGSKVLHLDADTTCDTCVHWLADDASGALCWPT